jgi:hypothetical protein
MLLVSSWSRPFVKAAVITLFIGTSVGTIYMLLLSGINIHNATISISLLHRELQISAVTILVMGVMYMLVPRIRSIKFKNVLEARISFILIIVSLILYALAMYINYYYIIIAYVVRLTALAIFAYVIASMLKVAPRVGRVSDYYLALALIMLIAYNVILATDYNMDNLNRVYLWLCFVVYVIFGVQYKTVPVFFGRATPIKGLDILAFILASISALLLLIQIRVYAYTLLIATSTIFAYSIYVMSKYRIPEFLYTSEDPQAREKISRLKFFIPLLRVSYIMLVLGLVTALLYDLMPIFALYDLAIHLVTIGFIGITIMNFMPIMLPPILGRSVNYTRFNMLPLIILLAGIVVRVAWNILPLITQVDRLMLGTSGFIVLLAMILYIRMIHSSMEPI